MKQQNVFRSASFEAGVTGAAAKALIASLIVIMVCGITGIGNATEATPSAGASICGGGNFTISGEGFGPIEHGAANCFAVYMKQLGKRDFEAGATFGVTLSVVDPLKSMTDVALDLGLTSCWDAVIDGTNNGGYVQYLNVNAKTFSLSAVVDAKDLLFTGAGPLPRVDGRLHLPADGQSQIRISPQGSLTYALYGDPQTASIDANGNVTAGTKPGSVRVRATSLFGQCYEEIIDVDDCDSCKGQATCPGTGSLGSATVKSVDVRVPLGWSLGGNSAKFMQIKADVPSTNLATPRGLDYNFFRAGVEKITNSAGLRQVRMVEGLADIVTNTANKYTISFYAVSNVLSKDVSGLHGVTNSPHTTAVVENPGNDTNKVRVTFTREGQDTVYDYTWLTNGWELSSGGGLRREIKTVAWTETNTLKTVTQQILNGSGSVVFQRIEKYRTNSAYYGQRLIEDATGTGPSALTNSYTWTTNGYLQQEVHADGSWAFYVYDSLNRPTNIYSSFGNQPLTTNKALCRFTEHTYTTNFTGGSGDDGTREIYRPRRTVEYVLNQEVGRSYFVALYGQWQNYRCVNPGAAWNSASNLVTVTRVYTNGFHVNEPFTVTHPDGSLDVFRYAINRNRLTNTVLHGHPDGSGTNIDDGTRTVSIYDSGNLLSGTVIDVASGITLDSETYSYDGYNRRTNTVYLDGTSRTAIYGCCGISSDTDREGTVTTYTYDALKRMLTTTRNGIEVDPDLRTTRRDF
jgi:YD repeat-containing protein